MLRRAAFIFGLFAVLALGGCGHPLSPEPGERDRPYLA